MANENAQPQLGVKFYTKPVENKRLTKEKGRPIFKDVEMVEIRFPGDKNRVLCAPAHEAYRRGRDGEEVTWAMEYPNHYEAFKSDIEYMGEGTPISELTFLTKAKCSELRALNIHTAETLSALDGEALKRLGMGARGLKDQATAYLKKAKDGASDMKAAAENAELREMIKNLQEQIEGKAPVAENIGSDFDDWDDADIKAWIKDVTGKQPAGNPSHDTLVRQADELMAKEKEAA